MENAAEALKIAGFTLLFVTALGIAMITIMQGKSTSEDIISYSDKTNYYSDVEIDESKFQNNNRVLTIYEIIPTLYRYKQENYVILFKDKDGNPLQIYDGETNLKKDGINPNAKFSYLSLAIETNYQEKWLENNQKVQEHVKSVNNYLVTNYKNDKFEEILSITDNAYCNEQELIDYQEYIKSKDNKKILGKNSNENEEESENESSDEIRVITYKRTN